MFSIYFKGHEVPRYIVRSYGAVIPSIEFGGLTVVYKYKGIIHLRGITGNSIIVIKNGLYCTIYFDGVFFHDKISPLSVFRRIRYLLTNIYKKS